MSDSQEKIPESFRKDLLSYPNGAMVGAIIEAKIPVIKYFRAPDPALHKQQQDAFRLNLKETIEKLGIPIQRTLDIEEYVFFAVIATRQQLEEVTKIDSVYRIRPDVTVRTCKEDSEPTNRSWFSSLLSWFRS